ncbi:hypothetical protein EXIGLDRAFT_22810 [Exidia glandulosa HHB12029]|uniref:C2H2-type domain-containing protein n=1 Tax=Exidia glandulosa HHB12029 TaxID=1314781 RepID=A0A165R0R4_EXIGL|nr:hypothetical protein EXIGLDRAFT_22810 [Exidia glandulosa HHB12029]
MKKHAALYRGVNDRSNDYIWYRVRAATSTVVVGKAAELATMRGLNRLRFRLGLRFRKLTVPIAVPGVQDGTFMLPDTTYMATMVVTWLPDGRVSLFLMTPHFCIASMQTTLEPDLFPIAQWQDATLRALRNTARIDHPSPSAPTFAGIVASRLAARKAKGTILACRHPPCGKTFEWGHQRRKHERQEHGDFGLECSVCAKTFTTSSNRKIHERTHTGEKPYECKYCSRGFTTSGERTIHERTHTGEKPYECKYCGRRFTTPRVRTIHERTHTGEKPYECKYCPRRFTKSGERKNHERTHTGEKPYGCRFCAKTFTTSSNCTNHERTHTGEKPYECGYCGQRFARSNALRVHERTHTKPLKAFSCSGCCKTFPKEAVVKQHISRARRGLMKRHDPSTHAKATWSYHPERLLPAQTERLGHGLQAQRCVWKFVLGGKTFKTVEGGITEGRVHVDGDVEQGGADAAIGELDEVEGSTMEAFLHLSTWEHMVQRIHTVQAGDDNTLRVWFVIKDDESGGESYVVADYDTCAEKFPKKLLQFYQGHLH